MILHLSPDAPLALRLAADAALAGHIGGGVAGIAAGYVAVAARKGGRAHRVAGDVFVVAMLVAYAIGAVVSPLIHQPANAFGGVFGFYLALSGWMTVKPAARRSGRFERGAAAVMAAAAVGLLAYGVAGAADPSLLADVPWAIPVVLAGLCLLAARLDLRVARAGGLVGLARLRRHLWRMCFAFFFGTGSLFLGQPKVFPPGLRGSPPLILLGVAPLLIMAFWLFRARDRRRATEAATFAPVREALT